MKRVGLMLLAAVGIFFTIAVLGDAVQPGFARSWGYVVGFYGPIALVGYGVWALFCKLVGRRPAPEVKQ